MGERVPVEEFLGELEDDFDAARTWAGSGDPDEYGIRRAMISQREKYVFQRLRQILKGQEYVVLPDAVDPHDKTGRVWRRDDWFKVMDERQKKQDWTGEDDEDDPYGLQIPFVPCEVPEDILALIRWRDGHALDWWGEELVSHNLHILERMERHELPEELRAAHDAFMEKDEDERYNLTKSALMLIGSY